jgi:hypothetical protein
MLVYNLYKNLLNNFQKKYLFARFSSTNNYIIKKAPLRIDNSKTSSKNEKVEIIKKSIQMSESHSSKPLIITKIIKKIDK